MIIPIVIIVVCMAGLLFLSQSGKKKNTGKDSGVSVAAQDFVNVREITDHVLYTRDNYCISYVRLQPPMSSLWSKREKRMKTNTLVAEVSKDRLPWTLTAVSRPMDISQLISQYRQMREETDDPVRKKLLKQEMNELQKKVGGGEAVERQFYIKIWTVFKDGAEMELKERAGQILSYYESIGVTGQLLKKPDIIRFCNLVHNPAYINVEDASAEPSFPMILEMEEDE
ncbi:MAG: hypothetical protein NC300_05795 [Bacteroidales bacterium]|nr:hypothetical protein [Clostridium sp.]MCM1203635.1 hypothetical protein [Bacteroidales bacterium]